MILRKKLEVKFNLGNYEMATVEAVIEGDTKDGINFADIDDKLYAWVGKDVEKLRKINAPLAGKEESALEHWEDIDG